MCWSFALSTVGTKSDLKEDEQTVKELLQQGKKVITSPEANKLCNDIKAVKYVECSALTKHGVKTVFDEALRIVIRYLTNLISFHTHTHTHSFAFNLWGFFF